MWAEEFGLGEMGLSSREFWSLTVREFWIKHAAFMRAEARMRALLSELSLQTTQLDDKGRGQRLRAIGTLRRYPVKRWLQQGAHGA